MKVIITTRGGAILHYKLTDITDTKLSQLERSLPIETITVTNDKGDEVPLRQLLDIIDTLNHITIRQIELTDK